MGVRRAGSTAALLVVIASSISRAASGGAVAELQESWQNRGQTEIAGSAFAIDGSGDVVVASGNVCTTFALASCNWFVRALDATVGTLLWEDRRNTGPVDRSLGAVVHGDRVFASGILASLLGGFDFAVRAYDRRTGTNLWEQRLDVFGEVAYVVGARGNLVFAAGRVLGESRSDDFAVFALDARTGAVAWRSVIDFSGARLFDTAVALDDDGARVFAAGPVDNFSATLVRALDANTGRLLWEERIVGVAQTFVGARQVVTHGGLVYVAGSVRPAPGRRDIFVRAYEQHSGSARWTHIGDGGGYGFDEVFALHATGGLLAAAGVDGCNGFAQFCRFAVRALDAQSGALVWHDAFQDVPDGDALASALTSAGERVYAGGTAQNGTGEYQWALRGYDLATGAVVFDERITNGQVNGLAAKGNTIYAAGVLWTPSSDDFVVRAYSPVGP